ncbi:MAG: DUF6134 family protein [Pseudomonadota bacterium]
MLAPQNAQAVIPDSKEIVFQILRNGSDFGEHRVAFDKQGDKTNVQIDINMKYALGPVALFRYEHSNEEQWKGDTILSMDSQTYDDGDDYNVNASWGNALTVQVNGESFETSPQFYSTSYWNPVTLEADKLLNTQKGQVEDIEVTYVGREDFTTGVETLQADRYQIESKVPIEVWYDAKTRQWVGLAFNVRGSEIEYKRLTPISGETQHSSRVN